MEVKVFQKYSQQKGMIKIIFMKVTYTRLYVDKTVNFIHKKLFLQFSKKENKLNKNFLHRN